MRCSAAGASGFSGVCGRMSVREYSTRGSKLPYCSSSSWGSRSVRLCSTRLSGWEPPVAVSPAVPRRLLPGPEVARLFPRVLRDVLAVFPVRGGLGRTLRRAVPLLRFSRMDLISFATVLPVRSPMTSRMSSRKYRMTVMIRPISAAKYPAREMAYHVSALIATPSL